MLRYRKHGTFWQKCFNVGWDFFLSLVMSTVLDGSIFLVRTVLEERTVFLNNSDISGSVERPFTFGDRFKCIWYIRRYICRHLSGRF